jgi:3',5'-nucleoside bisphosphate phosphatase
MIDLHSHTDESDGSFRPEALVKAAVEGGLTTLSITDHDTFAGYEKAVPFAQEAGLNLIRGIELNTRYQGRNIHLLVYFPHREPAAAFRQRLVDITAARRERNRLLIEKLQTLGITISLEEVEALGRTLTGRPHFARLLVAKGYAANREEAFNKYLGESGQAFIERESPSLEEAIALAAESEGTASLAHPIRLGKRDHAEEERFIAGLRDIGLPSIEVFHSDHEADDIRRYLMIAEKYGFAYTGGSDFHGEHKPNVRLGHAANGTIPIPDSALAGLRAR